MWYCVSEKNHHRNKRQEKRNNDFVCRDTISNTILDFFWKEQNFLVGYLGLKQKFIPFLGLDINTLQNQSIYFPLEIFYVI